MTSLALALGLSAALGPAAPALWAPNLPASPATLTPAPAARYSAKYSTVTKDGANLVSSVSDMMAGLAGDAAQATGANQPEALVDAFGRPFLRFNGSQFLTIPNAFGYTDHRNVAVFFVGRIHRQQAFECPIFSFGRNGLSTINTGAASLRATAAFSSTLHMPAVGVGGIRSINAASNVKWLCPGAQMQVISGCSRTTANGGTLLGINRKFGLAAQNNVTATMALVGGEIGRYAFSPGSAGTWGTFDLYEIAIYTSAQAISHAQAQTIATTLADHYEIDEVTDQLVLEGASTMQGILLSGSCPTMLAADYMSSLGHHTWRIVGRAVSGNTLTDLVARRNEAASIFNVGSLDGRNVLLVTVGRNDFGNDINYLAADHAAAMEAYLFTGSGTGVLEKGWEARISGLPATSATEQGRIDAFRALIASTDFLAACHAGAGETYAGKLGVVKSELCEYPGGNSVFLTTADANDLTYYVNDQTHMTLLGSTIYMQGGAESPKRGMVNAALASASIL